jgi:hypothetical protein
MTCFWNCILSGLIGLIVGAIGGAAAMWATCRPLARLDELEARVDELLRDRNPN